MKVLILSGGIGTRLYPYSLVIPKCAIPFEGEPFIHRVIRFYQGQDITILTEKEYAKYYETITGLDTYGFKVLLGTAGKIARYSIEDEFTRWDKFIVHYCDSYAEFNIGDIVALLDKYLAVMVLYSTLPSDYGIVDVGEDKKVTGIIEKPTLPYSVWTGILGLRKEAIQYIIKYEDDWAKDVLPRMIKEGKVGYIWGDNFIEVGSLPSIRRATELLGGGK